MSAARQAEIRNARLKHFQEKIVEIKNKLNEADAFSSVIEELEKDILELMQADRMTVYRCSRNGRTITSVFASGSDGTVIAVPLSTTSISGYVALSQVPLRINAVHNAELLKEIHPKLRYDTSFEKKTGYRCDSMIAVPIRKDKILLGVLQFINQVEGKGFSQADLISATELALLIADKFGEEFQATSNPYEYLVKNGRLTQKQLDDALEKSRRNKSPVTRLLIHDHQIAPEEIGKSLEKYYQVPFMQYDQDLEVPADLLEELNATYLKRQCWIPIKGDREEAVVLIDDPSDYNRIMEMERILNVKKLAFMVGLREDIFKFINSVFNTTSAGDGEAMGLDALMDRLHDDIDLVDDVDDDSADAAAANDSTIVNLVNQIIVEAFRAGTSDIHIEPSKGKSPAIVRIRVDGLCRQLLTIPFNRIKEVVTRIKVMSRLDIAERRKPQDGKCKIRISGKNVELRVATLPTVNGEGAVLRILAAGGAMPVDKLNLTDHNRSRIEEAISHPHGLFLVVGPTGSGKTTTLHAILGHLNTTDRKIWTAEDPVEITQPGLQQVQVQPKIGFNFAAAMRAFLRADPDIILIGEMRDKETSHIGVEASLTGHLVLSTLHTNSAPETITRLLDLGLDPMSFSDALLGILAQRLMRTLCGDCKEEYEPSQQEKEYLMNNYGAIEFAKLGINPAKMNLYKAKGCARCGDTGYRGRTGIHEFLQSTPEMQRMIYRNADLEDMRKQAIKDGMRTLFQDGIGKVLRGQSDMEQLRKVVSA
ncbi:MAG: general secretion pathway protein GspE [Kangiellaceae bacterium]|nr:general secretion pathway protein GspE [Kangiellaceae bacterium]